MILVLAQHCAGVRGVHDEDPVQEFTADTADEPFANGVRPLRQLHLIQMIGIAGCG